MREFVYITSPSYSGSTLLTFLLNAHPSVSTIGEMKGDSMEVEQYRCSCGEPVGRCSFWQELLARLYARNVAFDLRDVWTQSGFRIPNASFCNRVVEHRVRALPLEAARELFIMLMPACRRAFARICRTNVAFVEAVTELSGGTVFLDSSKTPIRLKYLRRIKSFRIKVILLVRDGRGVINSLMKHTGMSLDQAVQEWICGMNEIRRVLAYFDASSKTTIRYEDLCTDPDGVLGRVFAFIGVPASAAVRDFRAVEHHILGNQMRFRGTSEIRLDTKWTDELTSEQLARFECTGGHINRRFGYAPGVPANQVRPSAAV